MFNWNEALDVALMRQAEMSHCVSDAELARLDLIASLEAERRPVRSKLAAMLIRLGARLDPEGVSVESQSTDSDALIEGRLAAYLR